MLLQIFSQTLLGPVFLQFIRREADEGFEPSNARPCSIRWNPINCRAEKSESAPQCKVWLELGRVACSNRSGALAQALEHLAPSKA